MLGRAARRASWILLLAMLQVCPAVAALQALVVVDPELAPIDSNLQTRLQAAGYTVTILSAVPTGAGALTVYTQVWDVNPAHSLTPQENAAYLAYLQGGGTLYIFGDNVNQADFLARDNSIIAFVASAGGGSVTLSPVDPGAPLHEFFPLDVQPPFTGPSAVSQISFRGPTGVSTTGNGSFIAKVTAFNTGVVLLFGKGKLTNAPAGVMVVSFDFNFLDFSNPGVDTVNSLPFLNNLILNFTPSSVRPASGAPTLTEWGMILLGFGLVFVAARQLRAPSAGLK